MTHLYVKCVAGQGFPLVLFHGWGFDSRVWTPLITPLSDVFTVYVVDLPGFGNSDDMSCQLFQEQLLKQVPAQFAVLGWSMGGGYAIQLAHNYPDRVQSLIGVGASPRFIREADWPGIDASVFDQFMLQFEQDPKCTIETFVQAQTGKSVFISSERLPRQSALETGLSLLKTWDLRKALDQVAHACFMFGRLDAVVPAQTLKTMQAHYPQFEYVLFEKGAHMPFLSDQAAFVEHLRRFLENK